MKNYKTLKDYESISEWEKETIDNVYQAIMDGKIYASVVHVAKSGMSRRVKFYMIENDGITRISHLIAWLSGNVKMGEYKQGRYYLTDDGLTIGGCGMDVIFYTLYYILDTEDRQNWKQHYNLL